jgi:hypothetical protein
MFFWDRETEITLLIAANLIAASLSSADLIGAVVEKAQFGASVGLTEKMKLDLKRLLAAIECAKAWTFKPRTIDDLLQEFGLGEEA